jgi:uncharacterized protein involved in cysteine biosynthesis
MAQNPKKITNSLEYLVYPLKAIALIFSKKKLLILSLISVLLNIAVFISLFVLLNAVSQDMIDSITPDLSGFGEQALTILLTFLRLLISFVMLVVLYIVIAMPINAPIYSLMFNEVFKIKGIQENPEIQIKDLKSVLKRIGLSLLFELKKLFIMICLFILNLLLSFLLSFIPVFGQILTVVIQILILGFFGAIDIFEPVHTNELFKFRHRMGYLFKNPHIFPFAALGGFFISIPLLNIVMLPIFIIAGILVWVEERK